MSYTLKVRALAACALAAALGTAASGAELQYIVTDLGTLGGKTTHAKAMNDLDMVVGSSRVEAPMSSSHAAMHAFVWQAGEMRDLGTLGGDFGEARSINNRGEIVGMATDEGGAPRGFYAYQGRMYDLNQYVPLVAEDAACCIGREMSSTHSTPDLDSPILFGTTRPILRIIEANAVNDVGHVIGCGYVWGDDQVHGFLFVPRLGTGTGFGDQPRPDLGREESIAWRPDLGAEWQPPLYDAIDLGALPYAEDCVTLGVNVFDQVVGISGNQGFMWSDGAIDFLEFTRDPTHGNSCNDRGYTVGWWCHGAEGENTAAIWNFYQRMDLPLPATATDPLSEANDINEQFEVVGWMQPEPGAARVAVLWDGVTTAVDLNRLAAQPLITPYQLMHLDEATAVNEKGHIIGNSTVPGGQRGFILQVPKTFIVHEYDLENEMGP